MKINFDPEVRIRVIREDLFSAIRQEYEDNFWTRDEALNLLEKYRYRAHQLANQLPYEKKIREIEEIEESYQREKDSIEEMPMVMNGLEFLRENGYTSYYNGRFHRDFDD